MAAAFLHAGSEAKGQEGNPRPSEAIIKPQLNRRQNLKRVPTKHTALFLAQSPLQTVMQDLRLRLRLGRKMGGRTSAPESMAEKAFLLPRR